MFRASLRTTSMRRSIASGAIVPHRAPEQNALRAHVEAERRYVQDIQELHGKERGE